MNFEPLRRYLGSFYREKNLPLTAIAVYHHHRPVYEECFGFADVEKGRPMRRDTLVHLYSASKAATVTAGLQLVDAGKLDLDAPLSDYLPEFAHPTVVDGDAVRPAENPILVRHLFSMQAGLTYDTDTPQLQAAREATGGRCPTRAMIRAIAATPLAFEPGTRFRYSMCHDVLGALIEEVSGMRFGEYLQTRLFEPIGMKDTCFVVPEEKLDRLAPEYYGFNAATGKSDRTVLFNGMNMGFGPEYESGGGGLTSTLADYILLVETLTNFGTAPNGARILSPGMVELLRQNQTDERSQPDFESMGGWSKMGYGYGLGVRTLLDRERNNSLSQNGEFGWDGMLGCYWVCDPAAEVSIFYIQQDNSPWWNWHGTVRNTVYACLGE
ncbi:MAG: serine hydrolase domain-containing protein [Acutalibacteraceae bacterium]|jgi:CubicO group peptidase (beta-lactamase class C family)